MKEAPRLYVITGLPYSGKTTFAEQLSQATAGQHVQYDAVGQRLGMPVFERPLTPRELKKQVGTHNAIALANLRRGTHIVHDATNPTRQRRALIRELGERHQATPVTIYVDTPYEETLARWERHTPTVEKPRAPRELLDWIHTTLFEPPEDEEHLVFDGVQDTVPDWLAKHFDRL